MALRKWKTSSDGKYEIVSLTNETLDQAMDVMRHGFFADETVSIACELQTNPEAVLELEEMVLHAAKDGVSLIAIEIATGKVAAASFNIIEFSPSCTTPDDANYFISYQQRCKTPNAKCLLQFMIDIANDFNIFEHYKTDVIIEIMFLATLKQHRGHGLAKLLFECTIDMAKLMKSGDDVRTRLGISKDSDWLVLPRPTIVSALCSSFITQKISKDLGFENLKMIDFKTWSFNGKTFAEVIGPETPATSIDCFVL